MMMSSTGAPHGKELLLFGLTQSLGLAVAVYNWYFYPRLLRGVCVKFTPNHTRHTNSFVTVPLSFVSLKLPLFPLPFLLHNLSSRFNLMF